MKVLNSSALQMMSTTIWKSSLLLSLSFVSCNSTKVVLKPQLDYSIQDKYLQNLRPIFSSLTEAELNTSWGIEYQIGLTFAKKLDLYNAVTSFKRSDILIPENNFERKAEIQYHIINSYYFGKRYFDVIDTFENSILANTTRKFAGFHDLLVILFDAYQKSDQGEKAEWILRTMKKFFPNAAQKLDLTLAISNGDIDLLQNKADAKEAVNAMASLSAKKNEHIGEMTLVNNTNPAQLTEDEEGVLTQLTDYTNCQNACKEILTAYHKHKKSPRLAQTLNALLPGAGYLYLGQKQSAFTALTLNGLFLATAGYFIHKKNYPAALITLSFESGWYLGGISGAKESAKLYNDRLYETHAHHHMRDNKLFPILMLDHGF